MGCPKSSPSVWRVWIEIPGTKSSEKTHSSPSVWRVWIEMIKRDCKLPPLRVTLRVEGVD